jgi:hypothetical protein
VSLTHPSESQDVLVTHPATGQNVLVTHPATGQSVLVTHPAVAQLALLTFPTGDAPGASVSVGRAPEEIANLRSNWDAYLHMTDDGTWLTSIVDTGSDARNMTPNKVSGMGVTTFAVGADAAARLPGNPLVTFPDSHPSSMFAVAGVNDFTIMATIPTEYEPSTGPAYFTWRMATGGLFGLIINKGNTPGYIRVQGSNGTTLVDLGEIDIGIDSSNGAGATAILFVRRTAGVVSLNAWYDKKLGGGVQRPEQRAFVDVLPTPIPVTSQHLAGRGSITQPWQGNVKAKFHQLAWWDRAIDYEEVVDLARYMGLRCAIEGIEAPSPAPLAALYNGGKELHDGTGHLPRDADGYYVSRTTGERLTIDDGYTVVGSYTVGPPKVYGLLTASVTGAPATGRRSGFNALDLGEVIVDLSTSELSFLSDQTPSFAEPINVGIIDSLDNASRIFVSKTFDTSNLRVRVTADGSSVNVISTGGFASGVRSIIGGGCSSASGDVAAYSYSAAGALLSSGSASRAPGFSVAGYAYIGTNSSTKDFAGTIHAAVGFDGDYLDSTEMAAVAALLASGGVDAVRTTYMPQMCTDGMVCGAYDPAAPTTLFVLSGAGADVTVAQP